MFRVLFLCYFRVLFLCYFYVQGLLWFLVLPYLSPGKPPSFLCPCLAGIIDHIVRGKNDYSMPPSMVRQLKEAGIIDDLTPAWRPGGVMQWQ
jgi:hypothetical protein